MARTWATIRDLVEQKLQDTSNAVYTTAELDLYLPEALWELSLILPRYVKYTLTTGSSTKEITLTAEQLRRQVCLGLREDPYAEYPISENPKSKHNFKRIGATTTLELILEDNPTASASVYLYIGKRHILADVVLTDLAAAVKTTTAAGQSSLPLKSLGTESKIPEDATFTIAGDTTTYTVTADATIAANEATVSITPVLAAEATLDAVVTLVNPVSSLEYEHEEILANIVTGLAMKYKASKAYNNVDTATGELASIATALTAVATRIAAAVTDLASGRTEAAKIDNVIDSAATEVALINAQVDLTVTDLSTARALLGNIDNAAELANGVSLAAGEVGAAQGYLASASGYLREAQGREGNNAAYLGLAARELSGASAKASEAAGYGSKLSHELQIANAGRILQATGEKLIEDAQKQAVRLAPARGYTQYSES